MSSSVGGGAGWGAKMFGGASKQPDSKPDIEGPGVEQTPDLLEAENGKIPIVRMKAQPRNHKILSFGYPVTVEGEVPHAYRIQYPPDLSNQNDLVGGIIPSNFVASVEADGHVIYLKIDAGKVGPSYSVAYGQQENILIEPCTDIDAMWIDVLELLESSDNAMFPGLPLKEEALDFLDADPLFLFGIAAPETQKALEKAASVPKLNCIGQRPVMEEWFNYLNADPEIDKRFKWVEEKFHTENFMKKVARISHRNFTSTNSHQISIKTTQNHIKIHDDQFKTFVLGYRIFRGS